MNKTETKHRRKLNDEQLEVLELLNKFRFGSNDLIAQYFGKKDRSFVFKRLKILLEQELIGKRFDSSYRIQGKPAAYYLTSKGARILQDRREPDEKDEINLKAIYKNKALSEQFIRHCLDIFMFYNQLMEQYGQKLKFFTKADIYQYSYFPQPLPDAYMRLKTKKGEIQFLLELYDDSQPFFTAIRRIKQYIDYREEGEWAITETDFPKILFVCESSSTQKRLIKRMVKALDDTYEDDIVFHTTTKEELKTLAENDEVWQPSTESDTKLSLLSI